MAGIPDARDIPSANLAGESLAAAREEEKHKDDEEDLVDDDKDWDDWQEDEAERLPTQCLVTGTVCAGPDEAIASSEKHGLPFRAMVKGRSTYDRMKIVNFVRREAAAKAPVGAIADAVAAKKWDDEAFIAPFLQDDPLLFACDGGSDSDSDDGRQEATALVSALREENARLKQRIEELLEERQVACPQCGYGEPMDNGKGVPARGYRGGKKGA
eukprot:TRINITY_DN24561_c0_g1_i1.p1 TRINITY_DN24561_c0_g1~~TRINITY_DN24561_c0_g1_i1.p1  ORF type:complete len:214 (+),score=102.08 TRINITY_DN24561_c0_g1_i1:58-699(+)